MDLRQVRVGLLHLLNKILVKILVTSYGGLFECESEFKDIPVVRRRQVGIFFVCAGTFLTHDSIRVNTFAVPDPVEVLRKIRGECFEIKSYFRSIRGIDDGCIRIDYIQLHLSSKCRFDRFKIHI